MIKSKYDYLEYLQKDKEALGMKRRHPRIFGDEVWNSFIKIIFQV